MPIPYWHNFLRLGGYLHAFIVRMNIERFYNRFYQWVIVYGPKILIAIVVFIIAQFLIRQLKNWLQRASFLRHFDPSLKPFLISSFSTVLQVGLVLGIMQLLGIQMTVFAALIGAFGVAAGFALSGTLQNFTSGILIMLLKPFRVGDEVIAQGQQGIVSSIQIFYTVITTFDNRTVIVPNSKLSNELIVNLSRKGERRLDIELKFNYGNDMNQLKTILNSSVDSMKSLLQEPARNIGISQVEPDGFRMKVEVWVSANEYEKTKMELQEKIIEDLKTSGIKLQGMS